MPEEPIAPVVLDDDELDEDEPANAVATQPEDDDPLAFVGEAADAPADTGRPEGVGP